MLYSLFRVDLPIMTELVEEQTEHPIRQVFIVSDGTAIPLPRGAYEGVNRAIINM